MLNELMNLLGRPINDPVVKDFLEKKELKYPKRDTYSQYSNPQSIEIRGKKIQKETEFSLNFEARRWNPKYPEVPTGRGGVFYYRLEGIQINNATEMELLSLLKIPSKKIKLDEIFNILGERRKNIYNRYIWIVPIDKEKDICAFVYYDEEDGEVYTRILIPERPLFSSFPVQEFNEVLGKHINSPEVKAFIAKYNGVYPKKDTIDISIKPSDVKGNIRHEVENQYYIVDIMGGSVALRFGLKEKNEKYFPIPAKKENHFFPILNQISLYSFYRFNYEDNIIHFPMGVKSDDSLETIMKKWGKPLHGSQSDPYYDWEVPVDDNGDFILDAYYGVEEADVTKANRFYGIELNIRLKS